jgi:hypothetical protein
MTRILLYSPSPWTAGLTCPQCQSTRVRPLLPRKTDVRPMYLCRDCYIRSPLRTIRSAAVS